MKVVGYYFGRSTRFFLTNKCQLIPSNKVFSICILLLITTTFARRRDNMSEENTNLQCVLQGNGIFTKNLYKILAKSETGNIFFSPISIHAILSLTAQGSGGISREEFIRTLNVPSIEAAADGYKHVMDNLNDVEDVDLYMANKVYIKESYKLKQTFKSAIIKYFYSEIQALDFSQSETASKTINSWIENKTNQKIKDLVNPSDFDDLTRLVLVNAIYFKGKWAEPFDPAHTKTEKFYINDNDTIDVQMMHIKNHFFYKEDELLDAKVLELPYTNKNVSMLILLPNKRNGIAELEQKLADIDLTKITENMYRPEVIVSLPKFKIETTNQLNNPLSQMGLASIFDDRADFSEMLDSDEKLSVSKVIQKAFIEVNEEGAEAAAATGSFIRKRRAASLPATFNAEHPFVIILQFRENILFCGKILRIPTFSALPHDEL